MEISNFSTWNTSLYLSQPSSVLFAFKTAHFGPEYQVSMGPSPHLWFLHAKQRVLAKNYKSLWVPHLTCPLYNQNGVICTRISSLWWSQHSSVVLCLQNSDFRTRLTSLYGSQTSSVVLSRHNSVLSKRMIRLYWFQLSPVVLCMQNSVLSIRITSLHGSQPPCVFFACKTATFGQ